jgi:exopolysaccharide biosynthesis predicted pyruvyltransferase EpsI
LLNYPNHLNIGDHLIWTGTLLYLNTVAELPIKYIASPQTFATEKMDKKDPQAPILLLGGGNIGDIYPDRQKFTQDIVKQYPKRQIFILPQTIYFKQDKNLQQAAQIFNAHEHLTIFVRDRYSYELARSYFYNCRILSAPDLAFQMVGIPELSFPGFPDSSGNSILYMSREDKETNNCFNDLIREIPNVTKQDWISYARNWKMGHPDLRLSQFLAKSYRDLWQRGLKTPKEFLHRQQWLSQSNTFRVLYRNPHQHWQHFSLSMFHSGIYQFKQYDLLITNRLHGHILCVLLNIPHVFLPNSYYKNQGFYEAWTKDLPFVKFVEQVESIIPSIKELVALSSR